MKVTQKLRLIIDGVSFYTTPKQIRNGVGDMYSINSASQKCLMALEDMREFNNIPPVGLAGTWDGKAVQISILG